MAPVVGVEEHGQPIHSLVPVQKGINLSMLIDFLLQKTYHDLTILSELLPRKSDIERKIEIIQFATKARQQFIRLLALVKWTASAEKVDKCQGISSYLDQQNAYFIDTADTLVRIARETLVQARLPNFSLPTAVDVLTTGTFNRLPKCIKTKIIRDDPVSPSDKAKTLKRLNAVIQDRLVQSKISPEFTKLKIGDGKLVVRVDNEFEVTLMLMGDGADIPWRLLNIEFLMEDYETGDGKSLVHGMQIHYIHQIVQSRLLVEDDPLCDLYKTLHYFCLALQLEVFYTQSKRLIGQRWGDFVRMEEYVSGEKLKLSYCRCALPSNSNTQSQKVSYPSIIIRAPNSQQNNLILDHSPKLNLSTLTDIQQNSKNEKEKGKDSQTFQFNVDGIQLKTSCLSIEKIFAVMSGKYSIFKLNNIHKQFQIDSYLKHHTKLHLNKVSLEIEPYPMCAVYDMLSISVVQKSGLFKIEHHLLTSNQTTKLEKLLNSDVGKFVEALHEVRTILYLEKCRQCLSLLHMKISTQLPITNISLYKPQVTPSKLYLQFKSSLQYCMLLTIDLDNRKNLLSKVYLLKLKRNNENADVSYELEAMQQLNTDLTFKALLKTKEKHKKEKKRKSLTDRQNDVSKRIKINEDDDAISTCYENQMFSVERIKTVIARTINRVPFIELSHQLTTRNIIFTESEKDEKFALQILEFLDFEHYELKDKLISCNISLNTDATMWIVRYQFEKINIGSCMHNMSDDVIEYKYNLVNVVDAIVDDWMGLCRLYEKAVTVDEILEALGLQSINEFVLEKYDMKSLLFYYGPNQDYKLSLEYNSTSKGFVLDIGETGLSRQKSPHHIIQMHLTNELNQHQNLHYILKILHDTYIPLLSINDLPILPALGISNRVLSVVNNFTFIANSSTHLKLMYRNNYILDIYLMESSVLIKDGTLYRTDSTKAMRGYSTAPQLNQFLQLFTDKSQTGGYDYPFTPGGSEFEQQNEHFGPASHDSTATKDHSMRSPAVVISSPQAYNQFAAPSPGNISSVPSPGTFILPSPAPAASMSAMSPSTWPGSPPLVQGSPRTGKQIPSGSQSRQLLTSITVAHSPVPVHLTHNEFQRLFVLKDQDSPYLKKKAPRLCQLEKFFGSVMLRAHLLRVLRTDDTLKLEKNEHGVVVFSGTGKSGVETGLQYSVRLNPTTMDSLLLKITPMKGHENNWQSEDLRVLEQFFEIKVVCAPYKVCALTAFARILGTQPKIMKDFLRIMRLELQTDWSKFLFKVEWCLIIPPSDTPSLALPGTPGVVLRNKNLIFLQLTEVKNEQNTATVTIMHDLRTNIVQHLEFPKLPNATAEPKTWAVKARNCFHGMLQKISEQISKKDHPVFCAVYTVLMKMQVK